MTKFTDLIAALAAPRRYLVEITGASKSTGLVSTLYFSDDGFKTRPDDVPANQYFEPRIDAALTFARSLFMGSTVGGRSIPGYGNIVLENSDGGLDFFAGIAFAGHPIVARLGGTGFRYTEFGTIFQGTCDGIDWNDSTITIRLRDLQAVFAQPMQQHAYGGLGGTDGPAEIKGTLKPRLLGRARQIAPRYLGVVAGLSTFQVNDGPIQDVDAAYDGGVPLTKSATSPPAAGRYFIDTTTGILTTGSQPVRTLTVDAMGLKRSGVYASTPGAILQGLASEFAPSGAQDAASFATLAAEAGYTAGWYDDGSGGGQAADVFDALMQSVAGWWGFTRAGALQVGRLKVPAALGSEQGSYDRTDTLTLQRKSAPAPFWKFTVRYARSWTVQSADALQGSGVSDATRGFASQPFRTATVELPTVLGLYPNATELILDTLLDSAADAAALATYLSTLYGVEREVYVSSVKTQPFARELGDTVRLSDARYNLVGGKPFRLIAMAEDASVSVVEMTLWG
jgi:hypothetical protein